MGEEGVLFIILVIVLVLVDYLYAETFMCKKHLCGNSWQSLAACCALILLIALRVGFSEAPTYWVPR